jgi:hypothetical protein
MALQNIGKMWWPDPYSIWGIQFSTGYPLWSANANYTLNATNTRLGQVFGVGRAGTVTHLCFRVRTVTSAQTLRVGLYTVDAAGNPTSTLYGGSAYATQATPAADTQYEVDITDATMTLGDQVAFVVEWDGTQGDLGISVYGQGRTIDSTLSRYTSSWQTKARARLSFSLKYSDGSYWAPYPFIHTTTARTFNASTAVADEYALKVTMPFTCRAVGLWSLPHFTSGTNAYDFVLYEGTTVRATRANYDSDVMNNGELFHAFFSTPYTLNAGTTYYLAAKPNTTTNIQFYTPTLGSAAHLETFPAGVAAYADRRLDGGNWLNDIQTEYMPIGLIIDQLDDGRGPTPAELAAAMWSNVTSPNRSLS